MEIRRLYFREGKSDKVYLATLDGSTVTFSWGRRGATLQTKTEIAYSFVAARRIWERKIQEKLTKGYREFDPSAPPWGLHKLPMAQPVSQSLSQPTQSTSQRMPAAAERSLPSRLISNHRGRRFQFEE